MPLVSLPSFWTRAAQDSGGAIAFPCGCYVENLRCKFNTGAVVCAGTRISQRGMKVFNSHFMSSCGSASICDITSRLTQLLPHMS